MELFKLTSAFKPGDTIQNYSSLAWVERYVDSGDFQLVFFNDIKPLDLLPIGTLISHTDTREIMIVENHEFLRDEKKGIKVTLSGRSFETFLENRVKLAATITNWPALVGVNLVKGAVETGTASSDDAIANINAGSASLRQAYSNRTFEIKPGSVYQRLIEVLQVDDLGFKNSRPIDAQTTIYMQPHDGADRTGTVIFYAQREDLLDANYFWSNKEYKNYIYLQAENTARLIRHKSLGSDLTGLSRRVMYDEARDLTGTYSPASDTDALASRGQSILDDHRQLSLIQATISSSAKPKFKINYDVGDLVTVFGEFGYAQTMRVTEHVLTQDEKGIRGYPSLSIL